MIIQVGSARFDEPTSRLVIPLPAPTVEGTLLVVSFTTVGSVSIVNVSPGRWRQANEFRGGERQRTAYWYAASPKGSSIEVIAVTAHSALVTGTGLCIETAGLHTATALQALTDLIAGVGQVPEPEPSSAAEPSEPTAIEADQEHESEAG